MVDDPFFMEGYFAELKKTHPILGRVLRVIYASIITAVWATIAGYYISYPTSVLTVLIVCEITGWRPSDFY